MAPNAFRAYVLALAAVLAADARAEAPAVDPGLVDAFSARLMEFVAKSAAAGEAPSFFMKDLRQIARVKWILPDGTMGLAAGGAELRRAWKDRTLDERRELARSVWREGDVERTKLLAFFIMATTGDWQKVAQVLAGIPAEEGQAILSLFRAPAPDPIAPQPADGARAAPAPAPAQASTPVRDGARSPATGAGLEGVESLAALAVGCFRSAAWDAAEVTLTDGRTLAGQFSLAADGTGLRFRSQGSAEPSVVAVAEVRSVKFTHPRTATASMVDLNLKRDDLARAMEICRQAPVEAEHPYVRWRIASAQWAQQVRAKVTGALARGDRRAVLDGISGLVEAVGPEAVSGLWRDEFARAWAVESRGAGEQSRARWKAVGAQLGLALEWDDRIAALLGEAIASAEKGAPPAETARLFREAKKAGAPLDDRALHLFAEASLRAGAPGEAAALVGKISESYVQEHPETESLLAVLGLRPVLPRQFLLCDTVAVHTEDAQMMNVPGFGHLPTYTRSQRIPPNWKEPVDFADGSVRIVYEVLEKPNRRPIHFCFVMTAPEGARLQGDLPSHPGSRNFTEPGTDIEEGPIRTHFRGTYQGNGGWKDWDWTRPFGRLWEDSYRSKVTSGQDSSQYGPSSVFPVKVRVRVWIVAKGFRYHPFGNVGEVDFRLLRYLTDAAQLIGQGSLGEALKVAEMASNGSDAGRAGEARWVVRGLNSHAEQRLKEILEYSKEDADVAAEELKELAAQYRGHPLGARLAAEAAALDTADRTARCRRARLIWKNVLAESAKIEIPGYLGTERWDEYIPMPPEIRAKYAREVAAIKSGIAEMLSIYEARNWKRMAMSLIYNLGIRD